MFRLKKFEGNIVKGCDKNLREFSVNMIWRYTIHELRELQFSLFFVNLCDKLATFYGILHETVKITGIRHKCDFTI